MRINLQLTLEVESENSKCKSDNNDIIITIESVTQ